MRLVTTPTTASKSYPSKNGNVVGDNTNQGSNE
jgi:hypothetical protein